MLCCYRRPILILSKVSRQPQFTPEYCARCVPRLFHTRVNCVPTYPFRAPRTLKSLLLRPFVVYIIDPAMQRKRNNNEKDKVEVKKVKERHMSLSIFMSAETVLNIRVDFLLLTFLPSSRQHCRCMRYWSVKICRQLSSAKAYEAHTTTSCKRYQPYKCWMKRKPQRTTKRPTRRCLVCETTTSTLSSPRDSGSIQ